VEKQVVVMTTDTIQTRYLELLEELGDLERNPVKADRDELRLSCFERTKQLVEDTESSEPGPLILHGIVARMLRRWDAAEHSARLVTQLRPDLLFGWLDLTWALSELGRLDEAESCARRAVAIQPDSPAALGNLASILLERGAIGQAHDAIERALAQDPTDLKNQLIAERIGYARDRQVEEN
jgi:tetratricopeptide (TPR) repeat protein